MADENIKLVSIDGLNGIEQTTRPQEAKIQDEDLLAISYSNEGEGVIRSARAQMQTLNQYEDSKLVQPCVDDVAYKDMLDSNKYDNAEKKMSGFIGYRKDLPYYTEKGPNDDFAKKDTVCGNIGLLKEDIDKNTTKINELTTTVNTKANSSDLEALKTKVDGAPSKDDINLIKASIGTVSGKDLGFYKNDSLVEVIGASYSLADKGNIANRLNTLESNVSIITNDFVLVTFDGRPDSATQIEPNKEYWIDFSNSALADYIVGLDGQPQRIIPILSHWIPTNSGSPKTPTNSSATIMITDTGSRLVRDKKIGFSVTIPDFEGTIKAVCNFFIYKPFNDTSFGKDGNYVYSNSVEKGQL